MLSRTAFVMTLAASLAAAPMTAAQRLQAPGPRGPVSNVPYVSGGVGEEQQQWMQDVVQQGYTLKLLFAEKGTGAYVADVRVMVADRRGATLLDAVADGPAFFALLPEGDYKVTLEYRGMRQTRSVHASRRGARTVIYWAADTGSAPGSSASGPAADPDPAAATPATGPR
ncbi:MAG: carboxypeptidase regulatory-like domain-containing protein [Pseudomonadota bacterium]|nr:carboxypeptidase regulatory-like domain-containing protein [Pseudomonadota bacterium]